MIGSDERVRVMDFGGVGGDAEFGGQLVETLIVRAPVPRTALARTGGGLNDEPPLGEMGRCVEEVLVLHPPRVAVTLRP